MSLIKKHQHGKFVLIVSTLFILLLSCALPFGFGGAIEGEDRTPSPESSLDEDELRCKREGYPCTLSDLSNDVLARNKEIMKKAMNSLKDGRSIEEVAQSLEQQDDIVHVKHNDVSLSFRLEDSMPMWVYNPNQISTERAGPNLTLNPPQKQGENEPDGPVGPQPEGKEPKKQALILSPYLWDFKTDESEYIANKLRVQRNYDCSGCVTLSQQPSKPEYVLEDPINSLRGVIDPYLSWDKYEIIHLVSHGDQACVEVGENLEGEGRSNRGAEWAPAKDAEPLVITEPAVDYDCETMILTGNLWSEKLFNALQESDVSEGHFASTPGVTLTSVNTYSDSGLIGDVALTTDFFKNQYPDGLDDAIIFFSACQSFADDSFMQVLTGENTTFLGWDANVKNPSAKEISKKFYDFLIDEGLRFTQSYQETIKFNDYDYGFELAGANLLAGGDQNVRGREVITLVHPASREELKQGDSTVTHGVVKDGEKETLYIAARVDGVDEEQAPEDFVVHVNLNGEEVSQTFTADSTKQVDEYSYLAQGSIQLPFDITNQEEVQLEAWAELPSGGETRQILKEIQPLGCGWTGTMSGVESGEYKGLIMDYQDVSGTLESGKVSELLNGLGDTSGLRGMEELASVMGKTWLLTFNRSDRFVGMMMPEMGISSLPTLDTELLAYNTQNLSYQDSQSGEAEIRGRFSGSYNGLKMEGTKVIRTEGPTFEGEFTYHEGALCNMKVMMPILEHYGTVGPFGP